MIVFSLRTILPGLLSLGLLTSQTAWSWPPSDTSSFEGLPSQPTLVFLHLEGFVPQDLPPLGVDPQYDIFMPIVGATPTGQPLCLTIPKPNTELSKKRKQTASPTKAERPSKKQKTTNSSENTGGTSITRGYVPSLTSIFKRWNNRNAVESGLAGYCPMQVERKGSTEYQRERATDFHKYRAMTFYVRGMNYYNQEKYKLAARDFTTALNLSNEWNGEYGAEILLARANAFFQYQDYDRACEDFKMYTELYTALDHTNEMRRNLAHDLSAEVNLGSNGNIEPKSLEDIARSFLSNGYGSFHQQQPEEALAAYTTPLEMKSASERFIVQGKEEMTLHVK